MNRVNLTGRLTRDVESKVTSNGTLVASFSLAINSNTLDKDGKVKTYFPNCVAFGNLVNVLTNYTKKGSFIAVEGELTTRSYENKDGNKVFVTEVLVSKIDLTGSNQTDKQTENAPSLPSSPTNSLEVHDPYKDFGEQVILRAEDMPF